MTKTSRLRDQLYMLQGSRCFYCDRPIPPNERSLEHIVADSAGGFADDENAVVVCQAANHLLGDASAKRKMQMLKAGGGKIECPRQTSTPQKNEYAKETCPTERQSLQGTDLKRINAQAPLPEHQPGKAKTRNKPKARLKGKGGFPSH